MARPSLLPQHERVLIDSGIKPEVWRARGYRSVTSKSDLRRLGFGFSQLCVPALLIPIWNVAGEIVLYQTRPDSPRIKNGKPLKYETPAGAKMALDIPPLVRHQLGNPHIPLFITEGARKADAAISHEICCIALLGVWNFRGTNQAGGQVALADWESITLKSRQVYIVFDSDVMVKIPVHQALVRLKTFLESRGAEVMVIYLPPQIDGSKMGLDDFLASSHTIADLLEYVSSEVRAFNEPERQTSTSSYAVTADGLVGHKLNRDGTVAAFSLTNFEARITEEIFEDDGVESMRLFKIEARLKGKVYSFTIPAGQFMAMNWPTEHLGAQAIVYPGLGIRDHARCAIQTLSGDVFGRQVYAHVGWREIENEHVYLHAAGAIGKSGFVDSLQVKLPAALNFYQLPPPPSGADLRKAVGASLRLLTVAPPQITIPLFASIWRAAMGALDFGIHLAGPTGAGKSEIAALIQQHWGPEMTARQLPGNWSSTGNALESLAYSAKDAIFTIDDFAPTGTMSDIQRLHHAADRMFRAQGNRSGRQRMRADTTLKPGKPPRGLVLSTGEDVPRGQSIRARVLVVECSPSSLNWKQLNEAQMDGRQGLYAQALAGFLQWLASRYGYLHETLSLETAALRQAAHQSGRHRRTAQIVADLGIGLRYFFAFGQEIGLISLEESSWRWNHCWQVLGDVSAVQAHHQVTQEPAQRFIELLLAAVAAGRAHLATPAGNEPQPQPGAWGWRKVSAGTEGHREEWRPQGERIGWITAHELLLEPEASFATAQKLARESGETITVSAHVLRRRLHERGYLASVEEVRNTLTIRRVVEGVQRNVLHLNPETLTASPSEAADKPDSWSEPFSSPDLNNVGFVSFQTVTEGGAFVPEARVSDSAVAPSEGETGTPEQSICPPCYSCGGEDFWRSIHGPLACRTCHPPTAPDLVAPGVPVSKSALKLNEQGQEMR